LLLFADVGARLMMAPAELPVGLLTAVVGAPFFTLLLIKQRKSFL
jgi:iron complex transport system permease protein